MCTSKINRKSTATFVLLILISTLFGQGVLSGMVLCIGGPDHVALEPFHNSPHHPDPSSFEQTNHNPMPQRTLSGTVYSPCHDIPISISSWDRNTSAFRHLLHESKTLAHSETGSPVNLCTRGFNDKGLPKTSLLITSTFASLQTTILLI